MDPLTSLFTRVDIISDLIIANYLIAVRLSDGCGRHTLHSGAVCDTNNEEFSSVCQLLRRGRTLAYHGHCRV